MIFFNVTVLENDKNLKILPNNAHKHANSGYCCCEEKYATFPSGVKDTKRILKP